MYNWIIRCAILFCPVSTFGQSGILVENKVLQFSIHQASDTIDFILVDTVLQERKPVLLWCQGSLPVPLFCEVENYGYYFFGGGISNFDYAAIAEQYHLVVLSMPQTPVLADRSHLNNRYQYVPDPREPHRFSEAYLRADFLDNYVQRGMAVLEFLSRQPWVDDRKLIVAGHSQGSKIATKLAVANRKVTHLGLFAANPFGRIDQYVREARLDAQTGKISWEKADSLMNDTYAFYKKANDADSLLAQPGLLAWKTFSETFYDDWLALDIPIYLAYGTEDRTADLCDIIPLFFIGAGKNNLTLKRYPGLEHNFFELRENGSADHEKGHWMEVMATFIAWLK